MRPFRAFYACPITVDTLTANPRFLQGNRDRNRNRPQRAASAGSGPRPRIFACLEDQSWPASFGLAREYDDEDDTREIRSGRARFVQVPRKASVTREPQVGRSLRDRRGRRRLVLRSEGILRLPRRVAIAVPTMYRPRVTEGLRFRLFSSFRRLPRAVYLLRNGNCRTN